MKGPTVLRISRLLTPRTVAHAHCDLPCGVYDPAQARIEAESVKAIQVMQTLQRALDRATMTLGKTPAIEDPTKRAE